MVKAHILKYAGRSMLDFSCLVSGSEVFNSTRRDVETYSIPGRTGDLHIDNKRFENVTVPFQAIIKTDFDRNYTEMKNFLLSHNGYNELWDSHHPDEYRLARFKGDIYPEMRINNTVGKFTLNFDCKPQHYLVSGNVAKTFTASGNIVNPELFDAMPLIRIYGSGTVRIGAYQIDVSEHDQNYVDIDCELMDAFCGATNMNAYISVANDVFPVLVPGTNGVQMSGATKVEIVPRWWRL